MDLLTTEGIQSYFSKKFEVSPSNIGIADTSTDHKIPLQEVHITIDGLCRVRPLTKSELKYIQHHKSCTVKMVVIRRLKLFKWLTLWKREC